MAKKQQKLYFAKHHNGETCIELLLSESEYKKAKERALDRKNAFHLSGKNRCAFDRCCAAEVPEIVNCEKCFVCDILTKIKNLF